VIEQRTKKQIGGPESSVTMGLLHSIVSIDGIEDRAKLAQFVRAMPARDSLALRSYIKDNEPDVIMKQSVTCPNCGHDEEVDMPIGINFLWPQARR
jgi:hypothetical protein